jgi:hypothetical protein
MRDSRVSKYCDLNNSIKLLLIYDCDISIFVILLIFFNILPIVLTQYMINSSSKKMNNDVISKIIYNELP